MIASDMIMQALPWILLAGIVLSSLRMLLGVLRLSTDARPRAWRTSVLLFGQCASAALLFLLLQTAEPGESVHTLHLLTAHAPATTAAAPGDGELWLRLPEAAARQGIDYTPDLATALRQHPGVSTLHVMGDGLEARDRDAALGLAIRFERSPLANGIRDWWAPHSVPAGDALHVRGSAQGGARVELLDPAGVRVDQQQLQGDGAFSLRTTTRSPGLAVYQLRLLDADRKPISTTAVPMQVSATLPTRLLLRSGGPDPDLKFLRRWAADNGASLRATIDLGAGVQAGDPAFALDARALAGADVLILDDRSWNSLGQTRRATVLTAVASGMGLLLRAAAPLADGEALGMQVRAASLTSTFKLPVAAANTGSDASPLPTLTRPQLRIDNPSGHTVLRDDRGDPLAAWRAHGRGRVGLWLPVDSYRLALAGHADLHALLWADAINAVSRARAPATRAIPALVYAGERTTFCGLGNAAHVLQADDSAPLKLAIDPRSGDTHCAAFWPLREGWHRLIDGPPVDSASDTAFLVRASDADPVLRAARTQHATTMLASAAPTTSTPVPNAATPSIPRWAMFLLWLAVTSALWWFERSRLGRVRTTRTG